MVLYYDCFSGISGDMNLAAMIDLGVDPEYLKKELAKLNLDLFDLEIKRQKRHGIEGTRVDVVLKDEAGKDGNEHIHRTKKEIFSIIERSDLNEKVKVLSQDIFSIIAEAEGKVHGKSPDEIHFHEVGAVDSIVDIVGAAICYEYLKVERVMASTVELGGGTVKCAHGLLPVPAPATTEIVKNMPVSMGKVQYETTTPTGAAILASLVAEYNDRPSFKIKKTGYGIGHREMEIPNVLRVYLSEENNQKTLGASISTSIMIECNIDDMVPERYEYVMDRLFEEGAEDVFLTPIIMKKGRPAIKISALTGSKNEESITRTLLEETTSIGLRRYTVTKNALERRMEMMETPWGEVQVKLVLSNGALLRAKPEYDACKAIARENKIPLNQLYSELEQLIKEKIREWE